MALQPIWPEVRDLRTGSRELPPTADVCVVGAGISGLSVAYHLARRGKKVVVVEAGTVGGGQTGCTTAHLASVLDDRFASLERLRGTDACALAYRAHAAAIDAIEQTVEREQIDCDFARLDGYLVAGDDEPLSPLSEEAEAAHRAGVPVDQMLAFPHPGFRGGPCLRFPMQGRFDPMKYLAGLAEAVVRHGGTIVTNTRVEAVADGDPATVTAGGKTLAAKAVVVATNSPVNDRFALHTKQYPYLTYVVGLSLPAGAFPDVLLWDTADPYHYVRLVGDVAVVGGEDHKTGQADDQADRFDRLEAWARKHIPAAGAVTHRWSGQVLETPDGLGYIGRNPGDANVYVVTGDSGMGLTHGTVAGLLIPELIRTSSHPWADLFAPGRAVPARGLGEYAAENANVALQYASWLTPGGAKSADDVAPGCGAVVRVGLSKLAIYREENGTLHACSAKCPHLGAVVRWNAAEKTWDCPAHGSRFAATGEVTQGPANSDLEPVGVEAAAE